VRRGLGTKVRFLWVADLARPDIVVIVGVAAATALSMMSAPAADGKNTAANAMIVVITLGTVAFLWSASSAVALSMGAGSLVNVLQNWLLTRDARAEASAAGT
jgi:membrane protein insertase Oxa1/YidC/SpoIIIJ